MAEARKPDTASYRTFNDFFVRPLKDDARPIDPDASLIVLPADGAISQLGHIEGDQIFRAKGHYYTIDALLAGNEHMAAQFREGNCDHLRHRVIITASTCLVTASCVR